MRSLRIIATAILLSLAALRGQAAGPWPEKLPQQLSQPVNDLAGMLSNASVSRMDPLLRQIYANGQGPQVVLLTLPSIGDRAIEDVAILVARTWGIGDKVRKDGILLLVAKQERKIRIEVGTKFEGVLTDIACKRIISDVIVPLMRAGDVDGAVEAGVARILDVVAPGTGQALAPAETDPRERRVVGLHRSC